VEGFFFFFFFQDLEEENLTLIKEVSKNPEVSNVHKK